MAGRINNDGIVRKKGEPVRLRPTEPHTPGMKRPRVTNSKHKAFIKKLPCLICARLGVDPAHLRAVSLEMHDKHHTGGGIRPDDKWLNPLCRAHHSLEGDYGEPAFWKIAGIDPFRSAIELFKISGDIDAGNKLVHQIYTRQSCRWTSNTEKAFGR